MGYGHILVSILCEDLSGSLHLISGALYLAGWNGMFQLTAAGTQCSRMKLHAADLPSRERFVYLHKTCRCVSSWELFNGQ